MSIGNKRILGRSDAKVLPTEMEKRVNEERKSKSREARLLDLFDLIARHSFPRTLGQGEEVKFGRRESASFWNGAFYTPESG